MIVKNNYLSSFIILHHRAVCIEYGSPQKNSLKSVCTHPSTSCLWLQLTLLIISHLLNSWTSILCTSIKKQFRIGQGFEFFTELADGIMCTLCIFTAFWCSVSSVDKISRDIPSLYYRQIEKKQNKTNSKTISHSISFVYFKSTDFLVLMFQIL